MEMVMVWTVRFQPHTKKSIFNAPLHQTREKINYYCMSCNPAFERVGFGDSIPSLGS
jgi:hypothetical protein